MERYLQPAIDRFKALSDDDQHTEFRDKPSAYLRLYAFLSQTIPYTDPDLAMLYRYGRFLLLHLPTDQDAAVIKNGDEVAVTCIEDFMIEHIAENDLIVTRSMAAPDFQGAAFPILTKIFEAVRSAAGSSWGAATRGRLPMRL